MGSPTELMLECRPRPAISINGLRSACFSEDHLERVHRLEVYLRALEEERKKIEAFKRELPFCMQLLQEAIESSKELLADSLTSSYGQQLQQYLASGGYQEKDSVYQRSNDKAVLDEYIPVKKPIVCAAKCDEDQEQAQKTSCLHGNGSCAPTVQLWSPQPELNGYSQERCQSSLSAEKTCSQPIQEQAFSSSSKPFFHSKQKSGGAFLPFSRDRKIVQPTPRPGAINPTDLALACQDQEVNLPSVCENSGNSLNPNRTRPKENALQQPKDTAVKGNGNVTDGSNTSQPARKARRCWSPELHRRFVNALHQLGGSQVATPKQIRELMKVDGLTNDEVKSHLQKYRLHTRRPSPSQSATPQAPQVVMLGGIWVPPDYSPHSASQQGPPLYSSAREPQSCQTPLSLELHPQICSSGPMVHSSVYCKQQSVPAHSQNSPPGPLQLMSHSSLGIHGSGDTGIEESVGEDGKSENSSWKGQKPGPLCEMDEMEDQRSLDRSVNGSQSDCTREDETDTDDSRSTHM